jgi:putative glutamine amidotransferase
MRPLIGITTEREHAHWAGYNAEVDLLPANYSDIVVAAGGCPVLVPLRPGCVVELLAHLDGLLVSGGGDISAERYGATAHPSMHDVRPDRDQVELLLLGSFIEARRPVLAVCRGAQLLNVLRGGDLVQHLPDTLDGDGHRGPGSASLRHKVALVPGSHVAEALGTAVEASCNHHQAINRLGRGVRTVAQAVDGVIEAVELDDHPFAVAVQWHPEESGDVRLFQALVNAVARSADAAV